MGFSQTGAIAESREDARAVVYPGEQQASGFMVYTPYIQSILEPLNPTDQEPPLSYNGYIN
jgi:hypothetical protein